jgi:hypothetical protein
VIVRNLNIEGISTLPPKADSPLIIDANAELPRPISSQFLQTIGRRHSQVIERYRAVQHAQLSQSNLLDHGGQLP